MGMVETVVSWTVIGVLLFLLYRSLFIPSLAYKIREPLTLTDPYSVQLITNLTDAINYDGNQCDVLTNGGAHYPAELEAIRNARGSVNIEAYIFSRGEIARQFTDLLAEKAKSGVKVNLLLDTAGSLGMALRRDLLNQMRDAGCLVCFYHPLHVNNLERINIRTHREIMVIDGKEAFVGGAGVADHWYRGTKGHPAWRDMMVRIQGPAVAALQGTFVENWLESCGEVLTGEDYFPRLCASGNQRALVIDSSSRGRSTRARILFQVLVASAQRNIYVATPYFLPDVALRQELIGARHRGVTVKILTTGRKSDHTMTRSASRRLYGELLKEGVEIYEYKPSMLHVKMLMVDNLWSVIGTTNFDHRSFSINDEINVAIPNGSLNERLEKDFFNDLKSSSRVTYETWEKRSWLERLHEQFSRLAERQQ
jgi:cardiolipin synthase